MNWTRLLRGELSLTGDIALGFCIGALLIRSGFAEKAMKRLLPRLASLGIGPEIAGALALSAGSAKAGAAVIAAALDQGSISPADARWGTLMLAFPAYLRRWVSTFAISCTLAGSVGALFALILLLRSAARFALLMFLLSKNKARGTVCSATERPMAQTSLKGFAVRILKTLPLAWLFYALAFALVPPAEALLQSWLKSAVFFPLPALAISAASFAHMSPALALAGSSLSAGELTQAQALFALLFGSSLSMVTRLVRTNAGYYFGMFPRRLARDMLFWNVATTACFGLATLALAAIPLCF